MDWLSDYKGVFGVDLKQVEFTQPNIYLETTWKHRALRILVVRVEDSTHWNGVFSRVFPGFSLPMRNVGGDKWYSKQYAGFKDSFDPSKELLQFLNSEDDFTVFYNE